VTCQGSQTACGRGLVTSAWVTRGHSKTLLKTRELADPVGDWHLPSHSFLGDLALAFPTTYWFQVV
jgi:hypothetical protein